MDDTENQLSNLLSMWENDSKVDQTEPGKELLNVPSLHAKYLHILSENKSISKEIEYEYLRFKKSKWEYYTGRMSEETLKKYNLKPFPYTLKSDISIYMDSDKDLINLLKKKQLHDNIVETCNIILKEINNRSWELKAFIDYEKFIHGI